MDDFQDRGQMRITGGVWFLEGPRERQRDKDGPRETEKKRAPPGECSTCAVTNGHRTSPPSRRRKSPVIALFSLSRLNGVETRRRSLSLGFEHRPAFLSQLGVSLPCPCFCGIDLNPNGPCLACPFGARRVFDKMLDSDLKAGHRWRPRWSTMAHRAPGCGQTTVKETPEQVSRPFPTKSGAEATEQRS
ncbi:hypothetical protein NL676_008607 [Syzygium grande]|nr:hypothetical protein NL676_008607 [Syzygium grande]